mmetsp:Transcript_445/g.578  ORF Transcript_445/g.578 Transcript_445/m.578 type:complete len:265 (-) Transcript_445:1073-1867(-)
MNLTPPQCIRRLPKKSVLELLKTSLSGSVSTLSVRWLMVVLTCRKQKSSSWSALEGKESVYSQLRMLLLWKFTNGPIPDHAANEISTAVHRAYPFGMWSSFDYTDSVFDCTTRRRSPSRPLYMKYENFSWLLMKNHWNLVHDYDPDEKEHGEEAPYSGFIPLSAKIVDCGLREREFPRSVQQTIAKKSLVPGGESAMEKVLVRSEAWPSRAVIVVLGGVTRSELSAMRAVIKARHPKMKVLFAPTSLITGDEFIESSIYEVRGW